MANLTEIKCAKETGRLVHKAREASGISLQGLANLSGLSLNQVVQIENGNFFAFNQSLDQYLANAHHCAEVMGADIRSLDQTSSVLEKKIFSIEESIPVFLQRVA